MKTTHLLATLIAATLPLTAVLAEDTAKTESVSNERRTFPGKEMDRGHDRDERHGHGANDSYVQLQGSGC